MGSTQQSLAPICRWGCLSVFLTALTMERLATDILALLDELKLPNAVFVGCSIGGYVMLELWRRAPQRMRGLAFVLETAARC